MNARIAVALATAALLGCNKDTTGLHPGISSSCTVTLSAPMAGTYDCRPATTSWSLADNTTGFSFGVGASGSRPAIAVAITFAGEPATGTYTSGDPTAQSGLSVAAVSGQSWLASVGGGTPSGSYSLAFTSVVDDQPGLSGNLYSTEGTLTATLPAVTASGAAGTVTLTATF